MKSLARAILARILYMWGSLHRNFGNINNLPGEHQAAIRRFTQAYNLDPTFRQARLDRGIIYYRELASPEKARADFDALLAEDETYGPALLNRAMIAQEQGLYAAALQDLERYLALPGEDKEYRGIAQRTAALLREVVAELDEGP
jgi:tetratricopeptide (TPR) repeat protein